MGRIRVLSDNLANKIAAGEVVERPVSVVKELLENALDASAERVSVELKGGGRTLIIVEDDGMGMDEDDLLLALERHATSKLSSDHDLLAIATLGFRGEALPAIASVGRMTISSRRRGVTGGNSLSVSGGRFKESKPCGLFEGTRVEVRDLFFNVPARRKFLRSPSTELTHVITLLEHYALARPDVAFKLTNDGRTVLNLAPASDRTVRFFELFPEMARDDFAPVLMESGAVTIRGLAAKPERNFSSSRYQYTLVNGRFVRDRLLRHAITEAYENTHPKGRYPPVLLALSIGFDRVDVNVHPTKREVRFVDGRGVHEAVVNALRQAIAPGGCLPPPTISYRTHPRMENPVSHVGEASAVFRDGEGRPVSSRVRAYVPAALEELAGRPKAVSAPLLALAQWRSSFILCDSPEGLAIVDQHVAHERLRFEQLRRFIQSPGPRQPFLMPPVFTLPKAYEHRTEEMAQLLSAQGFEAAAMDRGSVAIHSAPAFMRPGEVDALLRDFFESAGEVLKTPRERWTDVLIMRSCRGSVMANHPMTLEKMQYLLDSLLALGAPLTCPHGRPIVFTLKERDILSKFGR